jgi:hypothetical protein
MAKKRGGAKSTRIVLRKGDVLAQLVRQTTGRVGKRQVIVADQASQVAEDELIVLVVGRHSAVAQSMRRPEGMVDLRALELGVAGAALAVNEVGPRQHAAPAALSANEESLLAEGGLHEPSARGKQASDDGTLEYLHLLRHSLSPDDAAVLLGVNSSRIRQRLAERRLFGVKDGRAWKLPEFQFVAGRLVPGIDAALAALPVGLHPVAVRRWFQSPHSDLELDDGAAISPLAWLLSGHDPKRVAELAALL